MFKHIKYKMNMENAILFVLISNGTRLYEQLPHLSKAINVYYLVL